MASRFSEMRRKIEEAKLNAHYSGERQQVAEQNETNLMGGLRESSSLAKSSAEIEVEKIERQIEKIKETIKNSRQRALRASAFRVGPVNALLIQELEQEKLKELQIKKSRLQLLAALSTVSKDPKQQG